MGWAEGSFFKKPVFSAFQAILSIFLENRVGAGQCGSRWVQVGQDDDLVGGQEVDSQDHHELTHHEGHVMHSQ